LETLDLGSNQMTGEVPAWIGDNFAELRILCLMSNAFLGEIPPLLSNLSSLQVLILAENNLSGKIPASLGDLKGMVREQGRSQYLFYANNGFLYC